MPINVEISQNDMEVDVFYDTKQELDYIKAKLDELQVKFDVLTIPRGSENELRGELESDLALV